MGVLSKSVTVSTNDANVMMVQIRVRASVVRFVACSRDT